MRAVAAAALLFASGSAATETLLHRPSNVPKGWRKTAGTVNRATTYKVNVGIKRSNTEKLTEKLMSVSDPKSRDYLQHLTWEEAGAMFRPAQKSIDTVLSWLRSAGASKVELHAHGDRVKAELTAAQLEAATGGAFEQFVDESGRVIERVTNGVRLPEEVASVVDTFTGFHGFPLGGKVQTPAGKAGVNASASYVTPTLINQVHKIPAVKKNKKNIQAIAQFQGQYVSTSDLSSFCSKYEPNGLSCSIAKYIGENQPGEPGVESMLDTEYIMGLGQGTETWVYSYPNFDFCGDLLTFGGDVTKDPTYPYSVSVSYGSQKIDFCDSNTITRLNQDVQMMGTMGVTMMISSGDDGSGHSSRQGTNSGKVSPSFPASMPYCTAVGSTYFKSGMSGEQEATTQFGSGGGFSYDYDAPSYQTDAIAAYLAKTNGPEEGLTYAKNGRGSPDVSLLGEDFAVIVNGRTEGVGGTSASSPSFAAVVTLLNNVCLEAGGKTLGFANPLFYQNADSFVDVTAGTSGIGENAATGVWKATKGWDAATGLGFPDFSKLQKVVEASCAAAGARSK